MRLCAAGARIALDPAVRGTHLKRWTLRSMVRTDFAARGAPWVALALERGGAGGSLNLSARHRVAAAAALATVARARAAATARRCRRAERHDCGEHELLRPARSSRGPAARARRRAACTSCITSPPPLSVPAGVALYARGRLR